MAVSPPAPSQRLTSIDVFRGLTILAMVFVNDLAHFVKGVPWWMRHMPVGQDGMTFVDVVFPGFLFIVGMAIPLALARRVAAGDSPLRLAGHVLLRTLGLLIVGVFMVNMPSIDPAATGMSKPLWILLVFSAVVLVWNRYPRTPTPARWLFVILRVAGLAMLVWLAVIYRSRGSTWMRTEWWGILGLIGWSYVTACMAYALSRKRLAGLIGAMALLVALYIGDKTGALDFLGSADSLRSIRHWVWLGGHIGTHSAITVAGMVVTLLVVQSGASVRSRAAQLLAFAGCLVVGGYLLRPLYGVSKEFTTPTYCLYTSAICTLLYLGLWLAIDVAGMQRGWGLLRLGGANPLLAYILPSMIDAAQALLGTHYLADHFNYGGFGVVRSLVTAIVVVLVAGLAYRLRVRLQF